MSGRYKYQIAQPYYTLLHTLYHSTYFRSIFMAALHSRYGHYSFALWFLSSFFLVLFSSPNLSGCRLDVYHTSTHGVALV